MRQQRFWLTGLAMIAGLGLVFLSGCGKSNDDYGDPGPVRPKRGGGGGGAAAGGGSKELEGKEFATVKGRVLFNGDPAEAKVTVIVPNKDADHCPQNVPDDGWYVQDSADKKGVRYAFVFLRAPRGYKIKAAPSQEKPGTDLVRISQPTCQFEPRVAYVHPAQKIEFINDSNVGDRDPSKKGVAHDARLSGPNSYNRSLQVGETVAWDLAADDKTPNTVSCGVHSGWMHGFVWKLSHPYGCVTDKDGNFVLKDVPITDPKLTICVWHEKLGAVKELGELTLDKGKELDYPISIPK
jgi:hypothetical protein